MRVRKWKPPFESKEHMPMRWKHKHTHALTQYTNAYKQGTCLLHKITITSDTLQREGWLKFYSEYSIYNATLGNNINLLFQKKNNSVILWGKISSCVKWEIKNAGLSQWIIIINISPTSLIPLTIICFAVGEWQVSLPSLQLDSHSA